MYTEKVCKKTRQPFYGSYLNKIEEVWWVRQEGFQLLFCTLTYCLNFVSRNIHSFCVSISINE